MRNVTNAPDAAATFMEGGMPVRGMEPVCRFPMEYTPTGKGHDPVLELHLRNCADCQGEVFVLRGGSAA